MAFFSHFIFTIVYHFLTCSFISLFSYLDDLTETGRIKGANTEETTNAAHSMIAKGLGAKVEIKNGVCLVPPDTSTQCHSVDLVMHKCDCKRFQCGCVCKHLIFSQNIAEKQGLIIQDLRAEVAKKIVDWILPQGRWKPYCLPFWWQCRNCEL